MTEAATTSLPDYYELLQVSPNADAEFIQTAYKRLVEKWHLERLRGDPDAHERLARYDEAYAVLSDTVKREEFDSRKLQPDTRNTSPSIVSQAMLVSLLASKSVNRWLWWPAVVLTLCVVFAWIWAGNEKKSRRPSSQENTTADNLASLWPDVDAEKRSDETSSSTPLSANALFARTSPAVVQVVMQDRYGRKIGSGSGFLVSPDGLIATNYHVVEKAEKVFLVYSDETREQVFGVVAYDAEIDLAIIKGVSRTVVKPLALLTGDLRC